MFYFLILGIYQPLVIAHKGISIITNPSTILMVVVAYLKLHILKDKQ